MEDGRSAGASSLKRIGDLIRRHPDLLICASITLLAAIVRLWDLGGIPAGIHGDEAQVGLDARRVLHSGWIGPYTWSALGQPSGHAYLTAPSVAIFGSTAFALRLPLTLIAIAAIPLSYVLFKLWSDRTRATFAAFLLAVQLWHLQFSRVAHWPISYPTVELGVLILWTQAIRSGRRGWFVAAGALLGLGLYTYNVYPVFVAAFAIWVAAYTFIYKRRDGFRLWAKSVGLAAAASIVVGLPLFIFIAMHSDSYFSHYSEYVDKYSVLRTSRFENGNLGDKVDVLRHQVWQYAGAYIWHGVSDNVDGGGANGKPMIDPATLVLFFVGLASTLRRWRRPYNLACLSLLVILPMAGVLQLNATYRGTLGLAPLVAYLAALPLAVAWREVTSLPKAGVLAMRVALVFAVVVIAAVNLRTYFGNWARSDAFNVVYAREYTNAVEHLVEQRPQPYVYVFSDRFSFDHETRKYLAPHLRGEDRSREFVGDLNFAFVETRPSAVLLIGSYAEGETLGYLQRFYPGGQTYENIRGGKTRYVVYTLPPPPSLVPPQ